LAPNGPNHAQPWSVEVKRDKNQPRGSIDSSSTGLSENNKRRSEKPCESFVILFEDHRPLVFTCKLPTTDWSFCQFTNCSIVQKRPIEIIHCGKTSIQIRKRVNGAYDSIHVIHPSIYQIWKAQDPPTTFRRPSLPIDPETEGLLALNDETLLKIDSIEIKFKNIQGEIQHHYFQSFAKFK
jgi:hypothetical protein